MDENERRRIRKRNSNFEITSGKMYYLGGKHSKKGDKKLVITSDRKLSILKLSCRKWKPFGNGETFYKLAERYYCKGMSMDVKEFIKQCDQCQCTNKKSKTTPAELQPVEVPNVTWTSLDPIMIQKENRSLKMDSDMC